ncbi:hypothetical protein PJL18_01160 [Paenarthrobacter nicotinovorans]|nr:hypothetical protein [Paenarthrobacter nicotinovorans]
MSTGLPPYFCQVIPESALYARDCACVPLCSVPGLKALVYMATKAGAPAVPKPEVLPWSTTTLPEKMSSVSLPAIATGCSVQRRRSGEVACPQDMLPQTLP